MILKLVKIGAVSALGLGLTAGILFGTDAGSYVWTSWKNVRTAVRDTVPLEFELQRARDTLEEIIPEMHANIRLIAQEEVEIANLKQGVIESGERMEVERARIEKLRDLLGTEQVRFTVGGFDYTREQIKEDLSRRFDRYKEAEVVLASKRRLIDTRQKSLAAAMQVLERTRGEKARLEDQIASLESQYRLVQAASSGSRVRVDNSKLAQTEKLISQIKQRLDVAERVLAHEAKFVQPIEVDVINEVDLLDQLDEHFSPGHQVAAENVESSLALGKSTR